MIVTLFNNRAHQAGFFRELNTQVFTKPEQIEKNHHALVHLFKKESIDTLGIQLPRSSTLLGSEPVLLGCRPSALATVYLLW